MGVIFDALLDHRSVKRQLGDKFKKETRKFHMPNKRLATTVSMDRDGNVTRNRRQGGNVKRSVPTNRVGHPKQTSHNQPDADRDKQRLVQSRGGISSDNTHAPVGHHRQQGHIDPKVASMPRGGDSRTVVSNNNSVVRRKRDNDAINIDRPLG